MLRYNVAFLGKSGVGKSTLINYLFGESIRETGTGKPVTERGFHPVEVELNGLPTLLIDSWGLEPGKEKEWLDDLECSMKIRGIDKPANEWFHSIFFCISCNHRVEELELDIIQRILDHSYAITILFTKSDMISKDEISLMEKPIRERFGSEVNIISVVCEEKKTRRCVIEPYGKQEIEEEILHNFIKAISKRLPKRCIYQLHDYIDKWVGKQKSYLFENTGLFSKQKPYEQVQMNFKDFVSELNNGIVEHHFLQEVKETVEMYNNLAKGLNFNSNLPMGKIMSYKFIASIPAYDLLDTIATIIANIFYPVGLFFTKELNYEDNCKILDKATSSLKQEIDKLEPQLCLWLEKLIDPA